MTNALIETVTLLANSDIVTVYNDLLMIDEFREFIERNKNKSTQEMIEHYKLEKVIGV